MNNARLALATWTIAYLPTCDDVKRLVESVRAAYVSFENDFPGLIVLRDDQHQIVKMVRKDVIQSIGRIIPEETG